MNDQYEKQLWKIISIMMDLLIISICMNQLNSNNFIYQAI